MTVRSTPVGFTDWQIGAIQNAPIGTVYIKMRTRKTYTDGSYLNTGTTYPVTAAWAKVAIENGWAEFISGADLYAPNPGIMTDEQVAAIQALVSAHGVTGVGLRTVLFGHSYIDQEAGGSLTLPEDNGDNLLITGTVQWANWLLGKPLQIVKEFGYGSRRVLDMIPRYKAEVAPFNPQVLFVSIGHNDLKGLYAGGSDQTPADVRQRQVPYIVQMLRDWLTDDVSPSTMVFLMAETPSGKDPSGATSTNNDKNLSVRFHQYNMALRRFATEFANVVYVPLDRVTVNPASLSMVNKDFHYWDTTHPGIMGSYHRGAKLAEYVARSLPLYCDGLPASACDTFSNTAITVTNGSGITFDGVSARLPFANGVNDFMKIEVGDYVTMRIVSAATGELPLLGRYPVIAADATGVDIACTTAGSIAAARVVQISNSAQLLINPLFLTMTGGQQSPTGVLGTITYGAAGSGLLGATAMPLGATLVALPATWAVEVNYAAHTQRDGSDGFGNWLVLDVTVSGASGATQAYVRFPFTNKTSSPATYDVERKLTFGQTIKQAVEIRQESASGGYAGSQVQLYVEVGDKTTAANKLYWKTSDIYRNTSSTPNDALNPWPANDMTLTAETPEMAIYEAGEREVISGEARVMINFFGNGTVRLKIARCGVYVVDAPFEDPHLALR